MVKTVGWARASPEDEDLCGIWWGQPLTVLSRRQLERNAGVSLLAPWHLERLLGVFCVTREHSVPVSSLE